MNEDALKERIKFIAKEKGKSFNEIWKQLLLERFLSRISNSNHQEKFIFKGGLLLAQYLEIGRETTDADFLMTKIKNEASEVQTIIEEIISQSQANDGFVFTFDTTEVLSQPHMEYSGFRVNLNVNFEKMKDKIQLDIGFGDAVIPDEDNFSPFEYKGKPIFEGEITLMVYPVETIFAEKLETIISKGGFNSRMKDYHDVVLMMREVDLLNPSKLIESVGKTFKNRGTTLKLPISFDEEGLSALQRQWSAHIRKLGKVADRLGISSVFVEILGELNSGLIQFKIDK